MNPVAMWHKNTLIQADVPYTGICYEAGVLCDAKPGHPTRRGHIPPQRLQIGMGIWGPFLPWSPFGRGSALQKGGRE